MYKKFFNNLFAEIIRDFSSFGSPFILILFSLILIGINFKLLGIIVGLIFVETFGSLIKFFYYKKRPNEEKYNNFLEKIDSSSFPSLHSARSSFVFLSLFLFYDSPTKIILLFIPLIVGLTRVLLKKHYVLDVIAGYFLGVSTFLVLKLFF